MNGYSKALMGFDFADADTLDVARYQFAKHLEQAGLGWVRANEEAWKLNHSWEFATYEFCPTGEGGGIDPTCSPTGEPGQDDWGFSNLERQVGDTVIWNTATGSKEEVNYRGKSGSNIVVVTKGGNQVSIPAENISNLPENHPAMLKKAHAAFSERFMDVIGYAGGGELKFKSGSSVIISDNIDPSNKEKYPFRATWIGSDGTPEGHDIFKDWDEVALFACGQRKKIAKAIPAKSGKSFMLHDMPPWKGFMDLRPGSPHVRIFEKYTELRERRYHLPGQHDQCDHSVTGECVSDAAFEETKREFKGVADKMTKLPEQRRAMAEYKTSTYRDINVFLRRGTTGDEKGDLYAKDGIIELDSLIAKASTPKNVFVYRGMIDYDGIYANPKNLVGKIFETKGFMSTSLSRKVAETFGGSEALGRAATRFRIWVPKGSRGLFIGEDEQEVLFRRGSKLRIKKISSVAGKHWIDAELVQ